MTVRQAARLELETPPAAQVVVPTALDSLAVHAAFVQALRDREPDALGRLFDGHVDYVRRVLLRVLGLDSEIEDLIQEVFLEAIQQIDRLKDPSALRSWLASIAAFKSRSLLRQRKRRTWLRLGLGAEPESLQQLTTNPESEEALRATYAALSVLPADERIAFALRFVEGMELTEVAAVCQVSLATIKRRLQRAEERFTREASQYPLLRARLASGGRFAP